MPASSGPLAGIEVLEIGSAIAGPFAGRLLADNGAHVTKIEPLQGTTYRNRPLYYDTHDADSLVYRFMAYNTSKDSIALNLKTDAGADILWELIDEADVILENMRPGVMERLGFDWESIQDANPELVYCSVTGYGNEEPYASWPAHDTSVLAISGLADQVGELDRPERMDVFAIDHATALYATVGILMALFERTTSGTGQRIDIAMFDVAVSFLGHHFAEYSGASADASVDAMYGGHFAPNGMFRVADGYLAMFVPPESWDEFCHAIDREEYTDPDHPYSTVGGRVEHRAELRDDMEDLLADRSIDDWIAFFEQHVPSVICAPVTRIEDVPEHPLTTHNDMAITAEAEAIGRYTVPGSALSFSRTPSRVGPVPTLGEHTTAVLGALGYTDGEIEDLRENGVIG